MKPLAACLLGLLPMALAAAPSGAACTAASGERVAPLVELYTSEGCSDCPPADAWLSALAGATAPEAATFLAFHVSYWDEIGWPDRFALKSADQRQELRVRLSGKRVTYTPQVMIGRDTTLDWRGRRAAGASATGAEEAMRALQRRRADMRLAMEAQVRGGSLDVAVSAQPGAADGEVWVWLALYEDGLQTAVGAGENAGRTLRHDRVVRTLAGPWRMHGGALSRNLDLPLPQALQTRRAGLVLFAESAADASPLQSLQLPLAECVDAG